MISQTQPPLIYMIAGEASGDRIGGWLMEALKKESAQRFEGIGGPAMTAQGLASLFPYERLSLMGFAEIVPHIPKLLARISQTVRAIEQANPNAVITIDSPGFCFRVAKRLRARGKWKGKLIHYVAPTVWAYKPERAKKIAKLYDHLIVILPFEPPYFEKEGLPTTYVGHPAVWAEREAGDGKRFREAYRIDGNRTILCVMPGSRRGEIMRHMPVMRDAIGRLRLIYQHLQVVMPVPPNLLPLVKAKTLSWPAPVTLITDAQTKRDALAASTVVLAKSGTVTLEVACQQRAMITCYRVSPITAWLLRRMVRVRFFNLINLIADQEIIPEFMQQDCTSARLSAELDRLLRDSHARARQVEGCYKPLQQLGVFDEESPSLRAARTVMAQLQS